MGDTKSDEAVQERMVQTDAECKRNSVISEKPKPPLPKKPPVAAKPAGLTKEKNQNKGEQNTSKAPPPLPKEPPKGTGGTAIKNALPVKSSASPNGSCDLKHPMHNHVTESSELDSDTKQSNTALSVPNHQSASLNTQNTSHGDGEKHVFVGQSHAREQDRTLEKAPCDTLNTASANSELFNTLPKTPPKVSPKPSKKPPKVLPKTFSEGISENCLNSNTSVLSSTSENEKCFLNNNFLDSLHNSSIEGKNICNCEDTQSMSEVEINKPLQGINSDSESKVSNRPLDLETKNLFVCPQSERANQATGGIPEDPKKSEFENNANFNFVHERNERDNVKKESEEHTVEIYKNGAHYSHKHSIRKETEDSFCTDRVSQNLDQSVNNINSSPSHERMLPNNFQTVVIEENMASIDNTESLGVLPENIGSLKSNSEKPLADIRENVSEDKTKENNSTPGLFVPSPAPRRLSGSPKPRPTPRKRLSLSKGCAKNADAELYLDCYSAKPKSASSENLDSIAKDIKSVNENSITVDSESNFVSPCVSQSISNISKIDGNLTNEKERNALMSNQRLSASHNLLRSDDKSFQKHIDFSPLTEEALGETSSLLDEIEQIVSRRISALGGQDFMFRKSHSIETSTPVRPPRTKKKNRKINLDHEASDTDSIFCDSSFKGSGTSLNLLDDGEQSFKGSNSSLASNQSESRKPCPPKPPRKKLLKLNRSQSDVSASKFNNKNKEDINQSLEKNGICDDGKSPKTSQKKGRSLTVDFHVPANQEPLIREIELANQRKRELELLNSSEQKIKPRRKAPPPPVPKVHVTDLADSNIVQESQYHDIEDDKKRTRSVSDQDYVEIPEEFLENSLPNDENDSFQRCNKSPSPPQLPPRNLNQETSVSSPQVSMKSLSTQKPVVLRERPMSDVSQNSSLSSQESPLQDEFSSSESEGENPIDKAERKKAKKIFCIAKEIASSEHVFVDVLRLLNVDFRLHISRSTEKVGRPVIPSEVLNRILNYLPQLQNFNEDLLHDLEDRVANWEKCKKVADIFVRKGPFLKMYSSYITDFEETNRIFDDAIKRMPAFQQCVREFEMSPRCASLGIKHYLLKPIQRIPQYKLLLQDYLKHLSPNSEDYDNTREALTIVSEVAGHANDSMRQGDQVQKMLEIQKSLDGHFEVIKPGRILIKEGELMKLSRKEMQPRMFFLFNDVLLYTTPTPTGGYRLNNVLTLVGMKVTLPASQEYTTEFNIVSLQRSFAVEASSIDERDKWVKALVEAIEDNTVRRNTFETVKVGNQFQSFCDKDFVLGSKAPIWIPDSRVTMCMLCTCQFSVAWRRHHCRSCGRVICSSCSDHKAPLEYLRNKPARVCNECYQKLVTDFEDKVNTGTVTEAMTEDTDGSFLSLSSLKERFQQIRKSGRFTTKANKQRPQRLVAVRANDLDCRISGNLRVLAGKKWKKYWYLLKDKVLYQYKASEDIAAIDTLAVIGYDVIRFAENFEGIAAHLLFQLSHKNQTPIIFQTDNPSLTERWVKAMEEAVKG